MGMFLTKELQICPLICIIRRTWDPVPSTFYDHFTTSMVDIATSGVCMILVAPSVAKPFICVDSCFSASDNKPRLG